MGEGVGYSASASGGTAGPSSASGSFFNSLGGFDGSGWNVNFGASGVAGDTGTAKSATPSVAVPANVGFTSDAYGLPNMQAVASGTSAVSTATTGSISLPVFVIALAVVMLIAKRHG